MKKLMIAAVAAALAGGAHSAPIVYKYAASVKFLNLKEVNVSFKVQGDKVSAKVYKKVKDSTKLKGWLIMDEDGVTSNTITGGSCVSPSDGTYSLDYGRNRGFLVVVNTKAKANVKNPKILPAVLDAKWIDTEFAKLGTAKSGLAEGTLFLGGDTIAAVRPHLEFANGATVHTEIKTDGAPQKEIPGYVAFSDYVWTSIYLFGQYNGPNWYVDSTGALFAFGDFEEVWDDNLPMGLKRGYVATLSDDIPDYQPQNAFHDTWMNGAGVGKWKVAGDVTEGEYCCGLQPDITYGDKYLDSLSGNLKGGLYLCTENGILVGSKYYQWFLGIEWEDQFVCCRDTTGDLTFKMGWQNDLWQDGAYEQETTDVIFGSWTINYNAKFGIKTAKELTEEEIAGIWAAAPAAPSMLKLGLWAYLKGAYYDLGGAKGRFYDGTEIYIKSVKERFLVPMLTPQFAVYYGLL